MVINRNQGSGFNDKKQENKTGCGGGRQMKTKDARRTAKGKKGNLGALKVRTPWQISNSLLEIYAI